MIPFTSKPSLLGQPAEGGAELAAAIVADPPGRVKETPGPAQIGCASSPQNRGWVLRGA